MWLAICFPVVMTGRYDEAARIIDAALILPTAAATAKRTGAQKKGQTRLPDGGERAALVCELAMVPLCEGVDAAVAMWASSGDRFVCVLFLPCSRLFEGSLAVCE